MPLLFVLPLLKLLFVVALVVVFVALLYPSSQPERLRAHLDYDAPEVRPRCDDLRNQGTPPLPPRLLPIIYGRAPLRFPDGAVEPQSPAVFLCGPREGGA